MEDFFDSLEEKLGEDEAEAFQASRDLFEILRNEEYEKISEIMERCGGCRRCGNCCRDFPCGIQDQEISEISEFLGMETEEFVEKYLVEKDRNKYLKTPCPFLEEDNSCKIYSKRPEICRWHPVKIVIPFNYQIRISERCELGAEIGRKLEEFGGPDFLEDSPISEELNDTVLEFSKKLHLNSSYGNEDSFILINSSTLSRFLSWLREG